MNRHEEWKAVHRILTDSRDAVLVLDADNVVQFQNRAAELLFDGRLSVGDNFGTPVMTEDQQELLMPLRDGAIATVEMCASDSSWNNKPAKVISLRDVTQRVSARQKIEHLNRLLRAIRNVNKLIVQEKDPDALIRNACEMLIESRGYNSAWIALGEPSGKVETFAHSGCGNSFEPLAQALDHENWPECSRKLLESEDGLVVINHVDTCGECPMKESYESNLSVVTMLRYLDTSMGMMCVSYPRSLAVDEDEKSLIEEVTGDIAFALYNIGLEKERFKAQEETAALLKANRTVLESEDFETAAHRIFDLCKKQTGATAGYVALRRSEDENSLLFLDAGGRSCSVDTSLPMPIRGLRADAYNKNRTVFENNFAESHCAEFLPGGHVKLINVLFAPIAIAGVVKGIIGLANKDDDFTEEDARRIQALGEVAALSLQRRRFIDEISQRKRLLGFAIEQMPVPVIIATGPDVTITMYNHPVLDLLARPVEDLCDITLDQHTELWPTFHPDGKPYDVEDLPLTQAIKYKKTTRNREIIIRHGDHDHLILANASPLVDDEGEVVAGILVFPEITENRRQQERISSLEQQARMSQRLESIGMLAGGIAHDFNNLLTIINNYTSFAIDEMKASSPVRDDLSEVLKAGQSAANLTRQLLAFSRKQIMEPEVLNLNDVIQGMQGMMTRLLGEDIDIDVQTAPDLGSIKADPAQLEQVIMNLAVNARDAIHDGGSLTIETANVDLDEEYADSHISVTPGSYVMLTVSDSGCGMDDEVMAHLFDPFFTTKSKERGTGLGLSTVYGIVKQSGGNIWAYSERGQGATFKIYLPRLDEADERRKNKPPSMPARGSETILVVEDEDVLRRLTVRILIAAGFKTMSASDGAEAIKLFEKYGRDIDLVLTDVVMPHMSGRDLVQKLLMLKPKLKSLYMSGYTDNAIVHHGVLDEGINFITKPFSAVDITRRIRGVLDNE